MTRDFGSSFSALRLQRLHSCWRHLRYAQLNSHAREDEPGCRFDAGVICYRSRKYCVDLWSVKIESGLSQSRVR